MEFAPTVVQRHSRPTKAHSNESRYWRRFKHPVFIKEFQPITSVHFSPSSPHRYAVTSATLVQIYAPKTQKLVKSISRFKNTARSGQIRHDGKLVVAGDDTGLIQIFDITSRAILRTLDEHKLPVHVTRFSSANATQLMSCSDDFTVKLWDVPSQSSITTFEGHSDYVRSGHILSSNPSLLLSGSYDSTVRLWDARSGSCEMTMTCAPSGSDGTNEQIPVWDVLPFPSGTMALSSSGSNGILRVWDLVAGGRCVRALSNHQKAATCLAFDGTGSRVLSGGLDHMVKVYDVSTYKVVHSMRYPSPILCLAISPDDTHIAAGMADGTFSIRRRDPKAEAAAAAASDGTPLPIPSDSTKNIFLGVGLSKPKGHKKAPFQGDASEVRVEKTKHKKLHVYDKFLKSFEYSAALDSVLKKSVRPATAFSLIVQLIHQDALRIALSGRDEVLLEPVLRLLVKYVVDPRFGELVCDISLIVLDMYTSIIGQSPLIDALFVRLRRKVSREITLQRNMRSLKGALDMITVSSELMLLKNANSNLGSRSVLEIF